MPNHARPHRRAVQRAIAKATSSLEAISVASSSKTTVGLPRHTISRHAARCARMTPSACARCAGLLRLPCPQYLPCLQHAASVSLMLTNSERTHESSLRPALAASCVAFLKQSLEPAMIDAVTDGSMLGLEDDGALFPGVEPTCASARADGSASHGHCSHCGLIRLLWPRSPVAVGL